MFKLLTLILFISLPAYGQPKPQETLKTDKLLSAKDWKTLKGLDYSIAYPADWTLEQFEEIPEDPGLVYLKLILYAPTSGHELFRKNISLATQDIKGIASDFNEYINMNETQIKAQATTAAFIESTRIKQGTNEYHRMTYLTDGFMGQSRIEQFYYVIGTKAFTFTFVTEQTKFQKIRKTALKIVESFSGYK